LSSPRGGGRKIHCYLFHELIQQLFSRAVSGSISQKRFQKAVLIADSITGFKAPISEPFSKGRFSKPIPMTNQQGANNKRTSAQESSYYPPVGRAVTDGRDEAELTIEKRRGLNLLDLSLADDSRVNLSVSARPDTFLCCICLHLPLFAFRSYPCPT